MGLSHGEGLEISYMEMGIRNSRCKGTVAASYEPCSETSKDSSVSG